MPKKYLIFSIVQFFLHTKHSLVIIHTLCYLEIVIRYFHLTTFYWMFIEGGLGTVLGTAQLARGAAFTLLLAGLYLFLQVQFPLSLATVKYVHFLLLGWGELTRNYITHTVL